jgi:hypothetical protein
MFCTEGWTFGFHELSLLSVKIHMKSMEIVNKSNVEEYFEWFGDFNLCGYIRSDVMTECIS